MRITSIHSNKLINNKNIYKKARIERSNTFSNYHTESNVNNISFSDIIINTNDSILMDKSQSNVSLNKKIYYKKIVNKNLDNSFIYNNNNLSQNLFDDALLRNRLCNTSNNENNVNFSNTKNVIKGNNFSILKLIRKQNHIRGNSKKSLNKSVSFIYKDIKNNVQKNFEKSFNNILNNLENYKYNKANKNERKINESKNLSIEKNINININSCDFRNNNINYCSKIKNNIEDNNKIKDRFYLRSYHSNQIKYGEEKNIQYENIKLKNSNLIKNLSYDNINNFNNKNNKPYNSNNINILSNLTDLSKKEKTNGDYIPNEKIVHFSKPIHNLLKTNIKNDNCSVLLDNYNKNNQEDQNIKIIKTSIFQKENELKSYSEIGVGDFDINTESADISSSNLLNKIPINNSLKFEEKEDNEKNLDPNLEDPNFFNKSHKILAHNNERILKKSVNKLINVNNNKSKSFGNSFFEKLKSKGKQKSNFKIQSNKKKFIIPNLDGNSVVCNNKNTTDILKNLSNSNIFKYENIVKNNSEDNNVFVSLKNENKNNIKINFINEPLSGSVNINKIYHNINNINIKKYDNCDCLFLKKHSKIFMDLTKQNNTDI